MNIKEAMLFLEMAVNPKCNHRHHLPFSTLHVQALHAVISTKVHLIKCVMELPEKSYTCLFLEDLEVLVI